MILQGEFKPPGDKSISHRLALISLVARGETRVDNFSPCADVESSVAAVRCLGGQAHADGRDLVLRGAEGRLTDQAEVDCGNSGTTIRLLMGLLAGQTGRFILDGDVSLRRRPMERVAAPLRLMGAEIDTQDGRCPVVIRGRPLSGLDYKMPVASAQLKTALLLAGLRAEGTTIVREPAPSRDHMERMLEALDGHIQIDREIIKIEASTLNLPPTYFVPGDISSAAFFICAATITPVSQVTAESVLLNPTRKGFIKVLERMGARLWIELKDLSPEPWGLIRANYTPHLHAVEVEAREIPFLVDEVPILALVATQAHGTTVFHDVGELRVKESDRLGGVAHQLGRMGARLRIEGDDLLIDGPTELRCPESLDSSGDHRLAMTLRLATRLTENDCPIIGEESVKISYPGFHDELARLSR